MARTRQEYPPHIELVHDAVVCLLHRIWKITFIQIHIAVSVIPLTPNFLLYVTLDAECVLLPYKESRAVRLRSP